MNKIFFLSLFLISIPSALSFKNVGNHKIYKTNILSKKKLEIISPKNNIELVKPKKSISKDDFKELNFNYASLYFNKESLKVSERKHGQIAMLAIFSILSSEIFISKNLIDGKGINLIKYMNDNPNNIFYILILYSIYELSFKGGLPNFEVSNSSLNKEKFFGRLSMLLIISMFIYEYKFDTPIITQDLRSIFGALILYFKILFSLN